MTTRRTIGAAGFLAGALLAGMPAIAAETITYTYDALGRVTVVASTGTVNNGETVTITIDKAGNRTTYAVTGA